MKRRALLEPIHVAATQGTAGLLADAPSSQWGIWTAYGKNKFDGTAPSARYDANLDSFRIGADRALSDRFVVGAALSFEHLNMNTRFNAGGQDANAFMLTPYLLFALNDEVSIDVNFGLGTNKVRQNRLDPTSAPATPLTLTSNYDSTRYFVSAAINGSRRFGDFTLGGRAGYLEFRERQDGYTETGGPSALSVPSRTLELGQIFAGVDVAYALTSALEGYATVIVRHDARRDDGAPPPGSGTPPTVDRRGYDWTLGLRYAGLFGLRWLSGYAEYVKTENRTNLRNQAINLLLRFEL